MRISINGKVRILADTCYTDKHFEAKYKKHDISISLMREDKYDIVVTDERGCYAVNTWERLPNIEAAIDYALKGACLL